MWPDILAEATIPAKAAVCERMREQNHGEHMRYAHQKI